HSQLHCLPRRSSIASRAIQPARFINLFGFREAILAKTTGVAFPFPRVRMTPIAVALTVLPFVWSSARGQEVVLPEVTVSTPARTTPQGLEEAYAGGQVARGGSLGLLGTDDAMDVPFSTTNYTS